MKTLVIPLLIVTAVFTFIPVGAQTYTILHSFGDTDAMGLGPKGPPVQDADGALYVTTATETDSSGWPMVFSSVVKILPDGTGFSVLHSFTDEEASAALILSGTRLYGTANGSSGAFVFSLNTDGTDFTVVMDFREDPDWPVPDENIIVDGTSLYGMIQGDFATTYGKIFKVNTDGADFAILKEFNATVYGGFFQTRLLLAGSMLYGTIPGDNLSTAGTVFKIGTDGTGFQTLKTFTIADAETAPTVKLLADGTALYGTTADTMFKVNTDGSGFQVLTNFELGMAPALSLLQEGKLYGTTLGDGMTYAGTVFSIGVAGTNFTALRQFSFDEGAPRPDLALLDSDLFGATTKDYYAIVFKLAIDGSAFSPLHEFQGDAEGSWALAPLLVRGTNVYGSSYSSWVANQHYGTVFRVGTDASQFTVLKYFGPCLGGGANPQALALIGETLYGTAFEGGPREGGTLFKLNTNGSDFSVLLEFDASAYIGNGPESLLADSASLYGTVYEGGGNNRGTVLKYNLSGGYTELKEFDRGVSAYGPDPGLTLSGSTIYGTTEFSAGYNNNYGTVYRLNVDGTGFQVLKTFAGTNGDWPIAPLALLGSTLYGATAYGGNADAGVLFKLNVNGSGFTVLRQFPGGSGGAHPHSLVASGALLYGTTGQGGTSDLGTVFSFDTANNNFTVLKNFSGDDGAYPRHLLLSGAVLYGVTTGGGTSSNGTVFALNVGTGNFRVLKHFAGSDGAAPCQLVLSGSTLYGTAGGGDFNAGVVFSLALPPTLVLTPALLPDGTFHLGFNALAGQNYTILFAPEVAGPWNTLTNLVAPASGTVDFQDPTTPLPSHRFYRVAY